jgi:hypothetical protein
MNIFGIKFIWEILDSMVKVLSQRVWVATNGELFPSYHFNVFFLCSHFAKISLLKIKCCKVTGTEAHNAKMCKRIHQDHYARERKGKKHLKLKLLINPSIFQLLYIQSINSLINNDILNISLLFKYWSKKHIRV